MEDHGQDHTGIKMIVALTRTEHKKMLPLKVQPRRKNILQLRSLES